MLYQQLDGTSISLSGAVATLYIYKGLAATAVLTKTCNILLPNQIDLFLTKNEILAFDFELGSYEVIVKWANDDEETFVEGPLVVKSGVGPFE